MLRLTELFNLDGKIALVTGGAGHLGLPMAETLAELGARTIICGRDQQRCEEAAGQINRYFTESCYPSRVDISDLKSVEKLRTDVVNRFGKIDILINNAYFGAGRDLLSMTEAEWEKGIQGSVTGVYRVTKAFLPLMLGKGYGSIINIASMYGMVSPDVSVYEGNPFYNPANYGAGKAAILQFTRYIACVYGKYGIRCNAVSPGPFPNEKTQENVAFIDNLRKRVPLNRIGKPEDLKGVVAVLASEASSYINGANLVVDGGWTSW